MYSNLPNCKIVKNCDFWNIKFPKSIWDSMKRDDELNELRVKSYLGHCSSVEFFRIGGIFFVNPFIALIKPDTIPGSRFDTQLGNAQLHSWFITTDDL